MGVAITPCDITGPGAELIRRHFNSINAENAMKMGPIHPSAGITRLRTVFKDEKGERVPKDVLPRKLKEHITAMVGRYKRTIYGMGCR